MDDWTIILWFFAGLFTDNLLGALYAWKLGPDRARKLVVNSLLDKVVISRIRDGWDFPRATKVAELKHDLDGNLKRAEDTYRTLASDIKNEIKSMDKAELVFPEARVDDLAKTVTARIRPSLESSMKKALESYMEEHPGGQDGTLVEAEEQLDALQIGDWLLDQGLDGRIVQFLMSKGPRIVKAYAMKNYPEYYGVVV